MSPEVAERTDHNRRYFADVVAALTPEQLDTPSLCDGWTVRHVMAHMVMQVDMSYRRFLSAMVRHRGSADKVSDVFAREIAERPVDELVHTLRTKADTNVSAPVVGPMGPFTDTCVHLRDVARPLGLDADVPVDDWRRVLEFLVTRKAGRGFVRPGRLDGIRMVATDTDWEWGAGHGHRGTSEELAMAACGRLDWPGD